MDSDLSSGWRFPPFVARSITTTSTEGGPPVVASVGKQCSCVTSVLELKSSPAIGMVLSSSLMLGFLEFCRVYCITFFGPKRPREGAVG